MYGNSHAGMVLSSVRSLMLPIFIRVTNGLWGGLVVCSLVCLLLYYVSLSLDCLCVYLCNMIVGGGMCHYGWMCLGYMLGIYLV